MFSRDNTFRLISYFSLTNIRPKTYFSRKMKINRLYNGFFFNAAFFAIIPHGSELTRLWFEILIATDIFGPMTQDTMIKMMSQYWRQKRDPELRAGTTYLLQNGYLYKQGTRYHLTDRSMLLIAQVERKLAAMVAAQFGKEKPGRPDEGKGYKRT